MDIPEGQGDFTILPLPTLSSDFLWQLRPLNFLYLTGRMKIYHTIHPRSSDLERRRQCSLIIPRRRSHTGHSSHRLLYSGAGKISWSRAVYYGAITRDGSN